MLGGFARAVLSRVAAVMVSLALTGAPGLAGAWAPAPAHRCHCAHGASRACSCPRCHAAAAQELAARDEKLPPCHRLAAQTGRARDAARACAGPSCGDPESRAVPPSGTDPFIMPEALAAIRAPRENDVAAARLILGCSGEGPAAPPPRAA